MSQLRQIARHDPANNDAGAIVPAAPADRPVPVTDALMAGSSPGTRLVVELLRRRRMGAHLSEERLATLVCLVDLESLRAQGHTVTGLTWRATEWAPVPVAPPFGLASSPGTGTLASPNALSSGSTGPDPGRLSRRAARRVQRLVRTVDERWGGQSLPALTLAARRALVP